MEDQLLPRCSRLLLGTPPSDACFSEGYDLYGSDLFNSPVVSSSAKECQIRCRGNAQCHFFVYDITTQNCFLKSSDVGKVATGSTNITGPKSCPGAGRWGQSVCTVHRIVGYCACVVGGDGGEGGEGGYHCCLTFEALSGRSAALSANDHQPD